MTRLIGDVLANETDPSPRSLIVCPGGSARKSGGAMCGEVKGVFGTNYEKNI